MKLANQYSKNLVTEDAILYFQKAIENFKSINAKKELSNAIEQFNNFIIYMGDIELKKGQKINSESLKALNQRINHFHNVYFFNVIQNIALEYHQRKYITLCPFVLYYLVRVLRWLLRVQC